MSHADLFWYWKSRAFENRSVLFFRFQIEQVANEYNDDRVWGAGFFIICIVTMQKAFDLILISAIVVCKYVESK